MRGLFVDETLEFAQNPFCPDFLSVEWRPSRASSFSSNSSAEMSKSVSVPQSLSDIQRGSVNLRRRSTTGKRKIPNAKLPLTGFVIFVIHRGGRALLYGTPADRAGISVGDEIIGVNDWTSEGKTKEDVIEHLQHCIRSRVIQLRVRRKIDDTISTDLKLGLAKVTEAFLVSVEHTQVKHVMKTLSKFVFFVPTQHPNTRNEQQKHFGH